MSKKYLFMMMGYAGSGKSYFARQLAEREAIARFNSDAMRMAFFGSLENMHSEAISQDLRRMGGIHAVNYSVEQVLGANCSVICDTANNSSNARQEMSQLAKKYGATPIVIRVLTPKKVALERAQSRPAQADQRQWDYTRAAAVIERMISNTDKPGDDEFVVNIDGTIPFEEQYESFKKQLAEVEGE